MKIGFIGAGKMAQALCRGLINSGLLGSPILQVVLPSQLTVTPLDTRLLNAGEGKGGDIGGRRIKSENIIASSPKKDEHFLQQMKTLGVSTTNDNVEVVHKSDVVFIATKPPVVSKVASEMASSLSKEKLVVSIAMGVTIRSIETLLPTKSRVVRVMPNTPAIVRAAVSAYSVGSACREGDSELVRDLLSTVGFAVEVPEVLMDPVTGLSGSGPAYTFAIIEGLADGGVKMGMPRDLSIKMVAHTLIGAAKMVLECDKHPAELKDDVQSPGGSTIYGTHKLESGGIKGILIDAVEAASLRSRATGDKAAAPGTSTLLRSHEL